MQDISILGYVIVSELAQVGARRYGQLHRERDNLYRRAQLQVDEINHQRKRLLLPKAEGAIYTAPVNLTVIPPQKPCSAVTLAFWEHLTPPEKHAITKAVAHGDWVEVAWFESDAGAASRAS